MAEDHRPPGEDVVSVALAGHIPHVGTLGPVHEAGGAADRTEGPDRGIHAAGDGDLCAFKEFVVAIHCRFALTENPESSCREEPLF